MELVKYKNTWVRKDKAIDRSMVKDCNIHYKHFTFDSESVVLDLGANVGGFATMVGNSPALSYIGYEPDAENFEVLQHNINEDKALAICAAVSMSKDKHLYFYSSNAGNSACSGSINKRRNSKNTVEVRNANFNDVLELIRPTHLKIDIEGAEYDWLVSNQGVFPEYIKEIAIELHGEQTFIDFDSIWYNNVIKDFDIVEVSPCVGFKSNPKINVYPNLGINEQGALFGIDIFMRRK